MESAEGYDAATYGDRMADFYDELPTHPADADAAARCLADLADGGPALELGIGTGRLALPLARHGVAVSGIDASAAMVAKLRAKPGGGGRFAGTASFWWPALRWLPLHPEGGVW